MAKNLKKEKEIYAEWLALKNMGKDGEKFLEERDFPILKQDFCKKYKIGKNTPKGWESEAGFWNVYHDIVTNKMKIDLPAIIKMMGKRAPQDWYRVMFPRQAKEAFLSKHEYSGTIGLTDAKEVLGDAFEVIDAPKREVKRQGSKEEQ